MPGGRSGYWVNHADGGPRWGDYVVKDLVGHVDATYNTIAQRGARAIGGISMGGHGALQNALNNPEVFGVAGGHSPGLRTRDQAPAFLGGYFMGTIAAASPGPDAYALRDPISLVRRNTPAAPPVLWIDMGQRDGFFPRATELHQALLDRGWAHTWSPAPGDHDGGYWRRRMPDYVGFYRAALAEFGA
jgi:S-formylglutathione hydrolase FrmB